jgi:hypothetical protein
MTPSRYCENNALLTVDVLSDKDLLFKAVRVIVIPLAHNIRNYIQYSTYLVGYLLPHNYKK